MYTKTLSLRNSWAVVLREVLRIGLFVFLLSISARAKVYLPYYPVPVTFQTLVVYLSVIFLGKSALYAVLTYLVIGIFGAPVFSAGAGLLYLLGPTGGYIAGFLLASMVLARILFLKKSSLWYFSCFCLADAVILLAGAFWLSLATGTPLIKAASIGILPFIYPDLLKIMLVTLMAKLIKHNNSSKSSI